MTEPGGAAWTSLAPLRRRLKALQPDNTADASIDAWFNTQLARVDDDAFASRFESHFARFEAEPSAYRHRIISVTPGHRALGGVRFYGGDSARAFIDIIAWDEEAGLDALAEAAMSEWRLFRPFAVRLLCADAPSEAEHIDQTIHVAAVKKMASPRGGVALTPVENIDDAVALAADRYRSIEAKDPALGAEISVASAEDLKICRRDGALRWIVADDHRLGVIGVAPGEIGFLNGLVVWEIVIAEEAVGRGLAAEAQRVLAEEISAVSPELLLLGTINRINLASRRSAENAGRPAVFSYFFHPLA